MKYPYSNLLIVIGGSAGGIPEIVKIVKSLPDTFQAAVIVATHRPPEKERNTFAELLDRVSHLHVEEPFEGESLRCTTIYVGKARQTIEIDGKEIQLSSHFSLPERLQRIDRLFVSAAESAGPNAVGVVLSGVLWDGSAGLKAIEDNGGVCIVQDPSEAEYADMPKNALSALDHVDLVGDTQEIISKLISLADGRHC